MMNALKLFAQRTEQPAPEENTILFTLSDNLAYGDIFALDPTTHEPIPLITDALAQYPVWSVQNKEVAFVSGQASGDDIFVLNIDQQNIVNLTRNTAYERHVRWSPDGKQLAFASDVAGDWEVFVMNRDSSERLNLSATSEADDGYWGLDWSPDGRQLIFTSNRNGRIGLYLMDADGSNQHLLLLNSPPSEDRDPVWSSNNQIAFISDRAEGYGIFVTDADASNLSYLSPPADFPTIRRYTTLSWSPDGDNLVFGIESTGLNSTELYLSDFAGHQTRLTDDELYEAYPTSIPAWVLKSGIFPISLPELFNPQASGHGTPCPDKFLCG